MAEVDIDNGVLDNSVDLEPGIVEVDILTKGTKLGLI